MILPGVGGLIIMKNSIGKKFLFFSIIIMFIGASIVSCMRVDSTELNGGNSVLEAGESGLVVDIKTLDSRFIYNITAALSNIILSEYDEENGEIAKGRAFGTRGEHKAAEIICENMTKLGLYTKMEQIENTPKLPDIAGKFEVIDYKLTITDKTSNCSNTIDCYIAPTWAGPRGNHEQVNYNFSFQGLKIKHKPNILIPWGKHNVLSDEKEDYVFIVEDNSYNPNIPPPIMKKLFGLFLSPYSDPVLFWSWLRLIVELDVWYNYFPHCKGLIRYDYNNDTHNMVNSVNWKLPVLFINGTMGKKILKDIDNITIDYYLNQKYNESVTSYNVIGQLNGTDENRIVIIDCLYDSWWCQGTADSAIGMGMVLGIAKYFKDCNITPKYTLKFIAFGGEEYGFRGAKYYEATHPEEDIAYVIDLNQLGFTQDEPKLYLEIIANKQKFLNEIWEIAERTDYVNKTNSAGMRKFCMPMGAPSDDQPFARNRPSCKTVCFLKGLNWVLHHRDGINHTEGDVLNYFNWTDVNATGEIILNITKYITIDSEDGFTDCQSNKTNSNNNLPNVRIFCPDDRYDAKGGVDVFTYCKCFF